MRSGYLICGIGIFFSGNFFCIRIGSQKYSGCLLDGSISGYTDFDDPAGEEGQRGLFPACGKISPDNKA